MASFDPGLHGDIGPTLFDCLMFCFAWTMNVSEMRIASNHFTKFFLFFRDASSTRKAKLGDELNS